MGVVGSIFEYFGTTSPREVSNGLFLGAEWVRVLKLGGAEAQTTAKKISEVTTVVCEAFALPDFFALGKKVSEDWQFSWTMAEAKLRRKVVDFAGNLCDVIDHFHTRLNLIDCGQKLPYIRTFNKICMLYADAEDLKNDWKEVFEARSLLRTVRFITAVAITALTVYTLMLGATVPALQEVSLVLSTIYFHCKIFIHIHKHFYPPTAL